MASPQSWRFLAAAALTLAVLGRQVGAGAEDSPVTMTARIVRSSFSLNGTPVPVWDVELSIRNTGASPVTLAQPLAVLAEVSGGYLGAYLFRRTSSEPARIRYPLRYHMGWGVRVPPDGSTTWPLQSLAYPLSPITTLTMVTDLKLTALEGEGYGPPIEPGRSRMVRERIVFPYDAETDGKRDAIVVVPPAVRTAGRGVEAVQYVFRFAVSGQAAPGSALGPANPEIVSLRAADLSGLASQADTALWRRVFALNWLAEHHPSEAAPALRRLATDSAAPVQLRITALAGLGVARVLDSVPLITDALQRTDNQGIRMASLAALADLADPVTATAIRPYITHTDLRTAQFAMDAAGAVKDVESVPTLIGILKEDKPTGRHFAAAGALGAIGTPPAVETLVTTLGNRRALSDARGGAAAAMGDAKLASTVPALATVAATDQDTPSVRETAVESLGLIGGAGVLKPLERATDADESSVRRAAVAALLRLGDEGATIVLAIADRSPALGRLEAVQGLWERRVPDSLPLLKRLAADRTAPGNLRESAVEGLGFMRDAGAVATLVPLISDRSPAVARAAVVALAAIGGQAAIDAVIGALQHTRADVRLAAATGLRRLNATASVPALWRAYRAEKDDEAGVPMARALVALGYADAASVPVLVGELDQRRQRLWFGHVLLLRHLTGQAIGPIDPIAGTMRERDAELARWRAWCVAAGHCR